ncbi:hypothetical protein [Staphylococcus pasteuri]|nr:hypothetical protein [Staphylococcus pasteuri]
MRCGFLKEIGEDLMESDWGSKGERIEAKGKGTEKGGFSKRRS